jgi:hypothetical protein
MQGVYKKSRLFKLTLSKHWCMNNICTCSAMVLLQDLMPPMSSKDICPETQLTQYYQSWWLGHEITLTAQQNTVGYKKGFPKRPLIFLHPKTGRSMKISKPQGGWFSQELFIPKGWSPQRNHRTWRSYPCKLWNTSVFPLCKDSPMWIVLSHQWLHKNRGECSSQMQHMITTNW